MSQYHPDYGQGARTTLPVGANAGEFCHPDLAALLLMDEPTAGMAPRERNALMSLTRQLVKELGIAVLFTEHSMDVVFAHADRIMVLARSQLIAPDPSRRARTPSTASAWRVTVWCRPCARSAACP